MGVYGNYKLPDHVLYNLLLSVYMSLSASVKGVHVSSCQRQREGMQICKW